MTVGEKGVGRRAPLRPGKAFTERWATAGVRSWCPLADLRGAVTASVGRGSAPDGMCPAGGTPASR